MDHTIPRARARMCKRPSWHRAVVHLLIIPVIAATALAGCGDDDDDSTSASPLAGSSSEAGVGPDTDLSAESSEVATDDGLATDAPATDEVSPEIPAAAAEAPLAAAAPAGGGRARTAANARAADGGKGSGDANAKSPTAGPAPKGGAPAAAGPAPAQPASGKQAAGPEPAAGPAAPGAQAAPAAEGGATDTGVTDKEIKIGMLSELSGPIAVYGQSFPKVVQAFFRDRNEKGGIHGRQLKLIVYDDAWDPVRGKAGAKRLVEEDKVFMLCCTQSLNTNAALTPYMDEVKIPYIGVDGLSEEQYYGEWTFPIGTSTAALGELMGPYAYNKLGARKAAIASLTVPGGPQYRDEFKRTFEPLGGEVVYEESFNVDAPDFSSFIVQARARGADFVTGFLTIVPAVRILQAGRDQGWRPEAGYGFDTTAYVDKLIEFVGAYANDIVTVQNHMLPYEVPSQGYDEFRAIVGKYYDLDDLTYSPWLALAGVAARMTMEAIEAQGPNLTRVGVREWVETIENWDTRWGVKLTFRPGKGAKEDKGASKRSNTSAVFVRVKDGKFVPDGGIVEAPSYKKAGSS